MILLSILIIICISIVIILKLVSKLISESAILSREELGSYECGFEHNNLSRVPFSLRYFYLTLVFLIFDLEIVFLLSIVFSNIVSFYFFSYMVLVFFVVILYLGLIYE